MKVSNIITRVRSIAGDTAVMQFTDSDIIDWLNDGIRQCALNNGLLQKTATSATVAGDRDYSIPPDIMKLHSITVGGNKLRAQTLQEWQETSGESGADTVEGQPSSFYVWGNSLFLYPMPNEISPLVIYYTYKPTELTFTPVGAGSGVADAATKNQDLPLPTEYQSRLVDYCLAQVAQQDGDSNLYQLKMQEFTTGVQQLKDKPEYQEELYPFISVSNRDAGSSEWYLG